MLTHYQEILSRLRDLKPGQMPQTWTAACPIHKNGTERHRSLSVRVSRSGKLLLHCFACKASYEEFAAVLGVSQAQFFPDYDPDRKGRARMGYVPPRKEVAHYDYFLPSGELAYQKVRYEPKDFAQRRPDPATGGWVWNLNGVPRVLYNILALLEADPEERVFVVEGEKDVESLGAVGILATTAVEGSNGWHPNYSQALAGRRCVLLPDNDVAGKEHMMRVAGSLLYHGARSIRIVELLGLVPKGDVTDWLESFPKGVTPGMKRMALLSAIRESHVWSARPTEEDTYERALEEERQRGDERDRGEAGEAASEPTAGDAADSANAGQAQPA